MFFVCVIQCWSMYLCKFHYECVRIHTSNCAHIGVLAFIVVTTHFFFTRLNTSDTQQETERLHRHRQRQPPKNG